MCKTRNKNLVWIVRQYVKYVNSKHNSSRCIQTTTVTYYVFGGDESDIGGKLTVVSKKCGMVVGMRENGRNLVGRPVAGV